MIFELCVVALFILVFTTVYNLKPKNYPPGPMSIPFVGAFLNLALAGDFGMAPRLIDYGNKFGKLFSIDMGSFPCVMINSSALIKEAFANVNLCGRPRMETLQIICGGSYRGLALHDGAAWKAHRNFTIKTLKDFGFGRRSLEPIIVEEATELVKTLLTSAGKPISTEHKFNLAIVNSLWTIIAGDRFEHNNPKLLHLIEVISEATSQSKKLGIFFFPKLAINFPYLSGWRRFKAAGDALQEFVNGFVADKKKTYVEGVRRDFTDVYIEELNNNKQGNEQERPFMGDEGDQNMHRVLVDLFFAGSETTATTLSWYLLYLTLNQDVQKRLQEEIDRVMGTNVPSLDHRQFMPYAMTVIYEALRCSSVSQVGIPHYALEDATLAGYTIPKGTIIFSNIFAAHMDPEIWPEPTQFRPERFLSPDGQEVVIPDALVAFSYGARACPGRQIALDSMFIYSTSILQRFTVYTDPSAPRPSIDTKFALTRSPLPHNVILMERKGLYDT